MIYFIQDDVSFLIKIGFTSQDDAGSRLAQLQTGSPAKLMLLCAIDGDRDIEGALHRKFQHARTHGEWFRPCP